MDRQVTVSARALLTVGLVAVALVAAYLVGHAGGGGAEAASPAAEGASRTVTVQGVGHVSVVPDQLAFSLGVDATRPDLDEALDAASTAMRQVVDTLVAQGVEEKDVQTTDLSMYPVYSRKPRTLTGYTVSQSVSVVVDDLASGSDVVTAAVGAGGDGVHLDDLRLQVADPESSLQPARTAAYEQAKGKATAYAGDVGAELGEVVSVSEVGDQGYEQPMAYAASDSAAGSVPISAGQSDLTATVTVVFELR
jgi:uncharacterized protein YggE